MPCIWSWIMPCEKSVSGAHYMHGDTRVCYLCEKTALEIEMETVAFIWKHWVDPKRERYA